MHILSASLEHVDGLAQAHVRAWQVAYADILAADFLQAMSVAQRAQRWRDILAEHPCRTLVAVDGQQVLGFVNHGPCRDQGAPPDRGEIMALYVHPEVWGRGAGRALLSRAVQDLRAGGFAEITLWVLAQNDAALRFYGRCGFGPVPGSDQTFELGGRQVQEVQMRLPQGAAVQAASARSRTAACHCGQLRIRVQGEPAMVGVCHCLACQQRTGSVFAALASFGSPYTVEGAATEYLRAGDQGALFRFRFCPVCGSTVFHTEEGVDGGVGVAVGAFADPDFPPPQVSVYECRRHGWVQLPGGIHRFNTDPV